MVKLLFASAALLLSVAVGDAFARAASYHTPFHNALSKRLSSVLRHRDDSDSPFEWEPLLTQCPTECAGLEQAFASCQTTSDCICTDAAAVAFRECMVCSIDLVNNPELQADAQQSMDELTVNCQSDGFQIASLSVAVAAPTAQPAAASPALQTSWSIPGTVYLTAIPTQTYESIAPSPYGQGPPASCWVVSDAWGISMGCTGGFGATVPIGFPTAVTMSTEPVVAPPAATGTGIIISPGPSASLGSQVSGSGSVAIPTTPISGSTLVTFVSSAPAPSASDLSPQVATGSNGVTRPQVSLSILTSVVFVVSVVIRMP